MPRFVEDPAEALVEKMWHAGELDAAAPFNAIYQFLEEMIPEFADEEVIDALVKARDSMYNVLDSIEAL